MPSWPYPGSPPRRTSAGISISNTENWWRQTGIATLLTSAVWSTANLAVYTPIVLRKPTKISSIEYFVGAAASGNYDVGVYLPDAEGKPGDRLWSSGSKVMAGTNVLIGQSPATPTWVHGLVYLAMAIDNTTGEVRRLAALTTNGLGVFAGSIFTEAAAFPLPATATPNASPVAVNVPIMMLVSAGAF